MRPENQRMKEFLKANGIDAMPKFLWDGSLKGCWRLYGPKPSTRWTPELAAQLTALGFTNFQGEELNQYAGNGGMFSVFVRGNNELLKEQAPIAVALSPAQKAWATRRAAATV